MEHYLLFAAYLVLFAWLVTKVKFFTRSGLSNPQLVILFLLKVMAGIFYGWIGVYYGQMAKMIDTWVYHIESLNQYKVLTTHPGDFFASLFKSNYENGYGGFLSTHNSWWNDLKANFLIKVLAIFNLFSFGNYYINVIFYSFISLFGPIAIFKVMKDIFPLKRIPVLIAGFLVPSFLYWTSGLHKEGLIFLSLSLILYHIYFGLKERKFPAYRILLITLGFCFILMFRNFLVFPLLPPLIAWIIADKWKLKPAIVFPTVLAFFLILFFTAKYISPSLDFPAYTAARQQEFLNLEGNSSVAVRKLEPNVKSFLINAPQAFSLAALRPYPSDVRHLLSLAAAIEIGGILLLVLGFLFWKKNSTTQSPFLFFCVFFSLFIFMMVGYTVNNLGAIVRYRSILFPLLVVPIVAKIDWTRLTNALFNNINNK